MNLAREVKKAERYVPSWNERFFLREYCLVWGFLRAHFTIDDSWRNIEAYFIEWLLSSVWQRRLLNVQFEFNENIKLSVTHIHIHRTLHNAALFHARRSPPTTTNYSHNKMCKRFGWAFVHNLYSTLPRIELDHFAKTVLCWPHPALQRVHLVACYNQLQLTTSHSIRLFEFEEFEYSNVKSWKKSCKILSMKLC